MSTLGEVYNQVLTVVPQYDKELLIRQKINETINYISKSGRFWRDIEETIIGVADGVDDTVLVQSIPITTAQRHFIYVKSSNETEKPITLLDPEIIVAADCKGLSPIAYATGSTLKIKHEQLTNEFTLSYYTSPTAMATDGSDDDETNWILDSVPGLVADLASAYILNTIGDKDDSKRITDLAAVFKSTYIRDMVMSHISN